MHPFAAFDAAGSALGVLTAMITPAVLISACGTLVLSTSNRLARVLDRMRHLPADVEDLARRADSVTHYEERRQILFGQMEDLVARGRLLQISLTLLYLGIAIFVSTSVAVGLVSGGWLPQAWLPVVTAMLGALMLLGASVLLIVEARLALRATRGEMELVRRVGRER